MGLLNRLTSRRQDLDPLPPVVSSTGKGDPVFGTRALRKFLTSFNGRSSPVLLDLGPVVGSNVTFFGERLGCKIFVEDLFADLERHVRTGTVGGFATFLQTRFRQATKTVDGVLCWDLFDYLDRRAALALATELTRLLCPDGSLLAFFAIKQAPPGRYTKYVVVDELNLRHQPYPASGTPQAIMPNRDVLRLFGSLRVSDSFLLQNNQREILFRKPS